MDKGNRIFPDFLVFCRWAGSGYLALQKYKKGLPLKEKDKKALRDAIDFLKDAKYGKTVIENLELGQNALTASYAFKEAFTATLSTFNDDIDKGKVEEVLNNFIHILTQIDEDKLEAKEELENLISFFSHVRESTLQSSASAFDTLVTWRNPDVSDAY